MALAVLRLAFGAVLTTSVNHDLHLPFAPRILIHKFIDKYSNYNSVTKEHGLRNILLKFQDILGDYAGDRVLEGCKNCRKIPSVNVSWKGSGSDEGCRRAIGSVDVVKCCGASRVLLLRRAP